MRIGAYLEKLDHYQWLSRVLTLLTLALALVIVIQARRAVVVHVAPPDLRSAYDIGVTTASRDYIEQMATYLVVNALTVNPESAQYTTKTFLRWLTPEARGKLETALLGDAAWIASNNVAQAFYIRAIDFYGSTKLRLTGTLNQWTAGKLITSRDVAVDLEIVISNYKLLIKDMAYVQQDDGPRTRSGGAARPISQQQ